MRFITLAARPLARPGANSWTIIDQKGTHTAMPARYAYSLNGENYTGAFSSREEALNAAIEAARDPMNVIQPQTVFVARRVEPDPHAAGHAKTILREMAWQAHDEVGAS